MMKSGKIEWQYAILALGITVCLSGAFLMWDGSIFGENTSGIAAIIGIIGIGLLGIFTTVNAALIANQEKRSKGIRP